MKKSKFKTIIVGAGASGKDHMRKKYQKRGAIYGKPTTTRPIREGEINGKEYDFIDYKTFYHKEIKDEFVWNYSVKIKEGDVWHYGLPKEEWEKCDVTVVNPNSMKQLYDKNLLTNCIVLLLDPPKEVRWKRLKERNDSDDARRRFVSDIWDIEEFKNLNIHDITIKNEDW